MVWFNAMENKVKLSPIVLFVYNRPWHTQQTINALHKNKLADQSHLVIYSDGPKSQHDQKCVDEVRKFTKTIEGFKSIKVIERDKNWGLADSIIDGVTKIVNKYGKVIVLEDDIVTSQYFLKYMNEALDFYNDEEKVMHVSGYLYPIENSNLPESFFLRMMLCWGWGTWKRSWKYFNRDIDTIMGKITAKDIYRLNVEDSYNYWSQFESNARGKIKTWAIFWYISVFTKNGLCLHPSCSMTLNIGHDGSGVHSGISNSYESVLAQKPIEFFTQEISENKEAVIRIKEFYKKTFGSYFKKIYYMFKLLINKVS